MGRYEMTDSASKSGAADTLVRRLPPRQTAAKSTIADLRALATARGFTIERAMTGGDRWRILDKAASEAADPNALSRVFSVDEGITYLKSLGGIARHPVWRKL
jgi:hypothetical protein